MEYIWNFRFSTVLLFQKINFYVLHFCSLKVVVIVIMMQQILHVTNSWKLHAASTCWLKNEHFKNELLWIENVSPLFLWEFCSMKQFYEYKFEEDAHSRFLSTTVFEDASNKIKLKLYHQNQTHNSLVTNNNLKSRNLRFICLQQDFA